MLFKRLSILSFLSIVTFSTHAQQPSAAVTKDPTAVGLATRSLAALTGASQIADVTLTGTAMRIIGSDTGSGTVTLKALGTSSSRMDLNLADGNFSEIRTSPNGAPQGQWLARGGVYNPIATHNCFTDAAWFFPALTVLSQESNPNLSITYFGQETKNGVSVQHLQFALTVQRRFLVLVIRCSRSAPLTCTWIRPRCYRSRSLSNTHPDNNSLLNIPVEVDFSNYQSVNGIQVPYHIQKYLNGSLLLDMTIQTAALNSGLTVSAFSSD